MTDGPIHDVRGSYDAVADEYAARMFEELAHKPVDRDLLDRFAARIQGLGPACDMGCGPGHVARHLFDRGVDVIGVDLSRGMVETARRLSPEIEFLRGDMRSLGIRDGSMGGIAAFYSIIHIPRLEVIAALVEMKRILRPGGSLLLAFHIGDEVVHLDEFLGRQVSVDFVFFRPEEMTGFLKDAGFRVLEVIEREPYPGVEHPSRRAYLFAEKPPMTR